MNRAHAMAQFDKLIEIVETTFTEDRVSKLKSMYNKYRDRIITAPASGKIHYHNAYAGGYIDHILNVIECAKYTTALFKKMGAEIDYTNSELIFAAMNHDLGKIGDEHEPYYIEQDSQWHRDKTGEMFKQNPKIQYMSVPDRALFLLQQWEIPITQKEVLGIKLADGMYDDSNAKYLKSYNAGHLMATNLPYVLHMADHTSSIVENGRTGPVL